VIPHTHAMQIFRYCEEGAIRLLWISGTNPAVSLPELPRIRSILAQDRLFVVVQDAFLTETARLADVVLPTALWGEKTGTFANADRTVHLSQKAVDPPGDGRAANELTITGWDPVSKQPYFKVAAVRLVRVEAAGGDQPEGA
jgi:anaerobic selenocysteine-containing dehydrogenase